MTEERRDIVLPLGDVSMDAELRRYYIDMRPAMVHFTENLYGGGFDENGVPMSAGDPDPLYFPINIAQYGFMLHANLMDGDSSSRKLLENCLAVLERLKTETADHVVWWHHFYNPRYDLKPPWASAMAQGEVISLYLRLWQVLDRPDLRETALKAYRFLTIPFEAGGVRRRDELGNLWLEEYPSEEPSFVLNGFIYAILGLFDLYRVTRDAEIKHDIDACVATLVSRLPEFDCGYWSLYDLQKRELVRYYYQRNVHVPQLAVLARLTGNDLFDHYSKRWAKQVTPLNYQRVRLMYRVRPRLQRLQNRFA